MSKLKLLCWVLVVVFLARGEVASAWWAEPTGKKYTATALLKLDYKPSRILPHAAENTYAFEFEVFRDTQAALLKSRFVISAALRDPKLKDRACIRREDARHNAVAWLTKEIRVAFPSKAAGIMEVSASEPDPQDAAAIVNAVVNAYMDKVVDRDKTQRGDRLEQLTQIAAEKENEVRAKREQLKRELEMIGAGDDEAMKAKTRLALQMFAEMQREFQKMRAENRILQGKLMELTTALADLPTAEIPEIEVTAHLDHNPVYRDLYSRLMLRELDRLRSDAAAPAAKQPPGRDQTAGRDQTQAEYDAMQKLLDRLEQQSRDQLRSAKRIALEQEKRRLGCQLKISTEQLSSFQKEVEKKQNEADSMGKSSVSALMAKVDVENVERILRSVSEERERLRVELKAEPRVMVLGDRNSPAAVPESPD